MQNTEKDPLVRALLVIIFGTIAFGLLFNLFTGGGNMEHMSTGMGTMSGNSLDSFLAGLLILLVKLLIVILVIAVIIGIVMWIKNNFFKNTNLQFMQIIKNDPILKAVTAITVAILGIILVLSLISGISGQGMMGYGISVGTMGGFNSTLSIYGLLSLLIKVLSFVLIISLILSLLAFLKKQYDAGYFNTLKTQNTNATQNHYQNAEEMKDQE